MAKRQTRRTISFNRKVYEFISRQAEHANMSNTKFVVESMRGLYPDMPSTEHQSAEQVIRARARKAKAL